MRRIVPALALLTLAACAGDAAPPPAPPAPPPPRPATPAPAPAAPVSLPPAPISVPPTPKADQCGAYLLTSLVGKPRTEIPIPLEPAKRRVVCTTCPRTQDIRPDRLTIEYDAKTGKVTKVACG